jgi:hypothetical protein
MHCAGVSPEWVRGYLPKREAELRETITEPEACAATLAAWRETIEAAVSRN